jgi:two-component system, cell cycle response regulator CpdR
MARILVAEDETQVREFVRLALERRGHRITAVEDGTQALAKLENERFDLLLTDIVMPGLDGIALALRVTRDRPGLPVLLMTGFAAERQRAHNIEALFHKVLLKPFSLVELIETVEGFLPSNAPKRGQGQHGIA